MANLYTKLLSKPDSKNPIIASITLRETDFELIVPGYKGGHPTSISYADVKEVTVGVNNLLVLKIKRTIVSVGIFDSDSLQAIVVALSVGKSGKSISYSKEWEKYISTCEKKERRAERRQKIADTISGVKDGIANALSDEEDDDDRSAKFAEAALNESIKAQKKGNFEAELKAATITFSDSLDECRNKLAKLRMLCNKYVIASDNDEEDNDEDLRILDTLKDGLDIALSKYPNDSQILFEKGKYDSLIKSRHSSSLGCIIGIVVFIIMLFLWYYLEKQGIL